MTGAVTKAVHAERAGFRDDAAFPFAERFAALREHGDFTLAYNAAAQPGLRYFRHGGGFLAFRESGGTRFVLGDPVAAPAETPALLRAFLAESDRPVFCQVTDRSALTLQAEGLFLNDMGPDHRLDLPNYSFAGKKKEWLRYAENWCDRRDFRVAEEDDLDPEETAAVTAAWRATRPSGEKDVTFLNRPTTGDPEPGVRQFSLRAPSRNGANGELLAYFSFDPLYRGGEAVGYVTCLKRRRPEAPSLGEAAVMKHAIDIFKEEGRETLRLGLSPFADGKTLDYRENKLLAQTFRLAFEANWVNRGFYALENHSAYKRRFRGAEERTYFASERWFNMKPLWRLAKLMGLI